ncbi:MAG: FtsX-like permease family protein [Candidatus Latescibacteria bacterium]|nr:FtsX-like permease family protein [Candidatus Latescibacterota bacterium]NIM20951.1 FtsX-like permease family protein [Candidatus Latescibacterota bacterium]NIM65086.1 FtsX-like permease family protein [Candidatus Latescibacterota bacterium]NIO01601.1 FtsX-like permease family protein [Candidatus Latescibacterota bacterium]NIO28118.1 FtsX-like permease family protein [Candidatus Latescibacterota bacterium]
MNYPLFIAKRHLQTKKRSALVSRIMSIAVGGVFVGVMTLVIVLSVINGFETELRQRIVGFNANVMVFMRNPGAWQRVDSLSAVLGDMEGVVAAAPFIRSEALAAYEIIPGRRTQIRGVIVKGVDLTREALVSTVIDSIKPEIDSFDASFFEDEEPRFGVVMGLDLAVEMRIGLGEELALVTAPATIRTDDFEPQMVKCRVLGFFNSGMYEFDSRFIYMDINDVDRIFDFETGVRGIGVKLGNIYAAQEMDVRIQKMLPIQHYGTNNWINLNQNLFSYMKIEKILMFLMLTLIILVAAFNLVGMLTMVIMEKRTEIGVLKSMGASSKGVMSIFMLEGTIIGVLGTLGGMIAGLIACYVLDRIQLNLPGDVYFIKTLPVLVEWQDLLAVGGSAILICFVATVYPSWEASKLLPVEALRND